MKDLPDKMGRNALMFDELKVEKFDFPLMMQEELLKKR